MPILVFGSINMDLVARAPHLPAPGETLTGRSFETIPGGKGANQAVACARLGVETRMVGRVGGDGFGRRLLDGLAAAGVDGRAVAVDTGTSSGVALITVDDAAENSIIVVPGANGRVDESDLGRLEEALPGASVLLLQLEIPLPLVLAAAQAAHDRGLRVVLDPAPAQPLPGALFPLLDFLTPNETEAAVLAGFPVDSPQAAGRAAAALQARGARNVIVKMGAQGVYALLDGEESLFPAFHVEAVDTVAAGDAFNGALAAALSEGRSIEQAIRWGLAGGALSVTRRGAQPAMPSRDELQAFLQSQKAA